MTLHNDKEKLPIASAVLFHANDLRTDEIYSPENLLTYHRNLKQRWIWINQESPANIDHAHLYNGLFNWTATYYRNSDIVIPYGRYVKTNYKVTRRQRNYKTTARHLVRKKKGLIAWCVSDCGRLRQKYVLHLQKYVNITVFGNCKDRFRYSGTCLKGTKECSKLLSQFKFYLAFENSICQDYVTEKYWDNVLQHESVPIVFGANYDSTVAIPSSFINIRQFDSVANLAKFILYLDRNDEEFMKYFAWKERYTLLPTKDLLCSICESLHDSTLPAKVHENLGEFWSKKRHCDPYKFISQKIERQTKH